MDLEFLRTEVLKSLDVIDSLQASNESLTADLAAAKAATAKAVAANTAREASAAGDAASAGAAVARALKAQLIYRGGGCSLRAEVVNLSEAAFALLSAGRGKSFNVDESGFGTTFGGSSLYKCLRYGAALVPMWPVRVRAEARLLRGSAAAADNARMLAARSLLLRRRSCTCRTTALGR